MASRYLIVPYSCKKFWAGILAVAFAWTLIATDVLALEGTFGSDGKISLDTTLSYSTAWRVEDPETSLLGSTGNARFEKGEQYLSAFTLLAELDLKWKEDYGAFLRYRGLYDTVYNDATFRREARNVHGKDSDILDAFVSGNFTLSDFPLTLRVGRQAVFWGESLLIFGSIATAQSPLDTTKANVPAVEAKELILPTGQVYGSISTPDSKLTLASYYKWEWDKSVLDESGTYFSTNDAIDSAGRNLGPFPRGADRGEKDGGEYGVALRYLLDGGDEIGLYYLNYRETLPLVRLDLVNFNYFLEYQDDVKLYGATYSTVLGKTNVAGEVSYRPNIKVQMAAPALRPTYEEAELLQAQVSLIHIFADVPFADSATLFAEWGYNRVLDFDDDELAKDKWATGGKAKFVLDYFYIAPGLDMKVPISITYNPKGRTAYSISGFNEDANSVGVGAEFTYLSDYKAAINYVAFLGDPEDNNKTDHDFVGLNLKYTF